ncbi:MAG: efflux RND transporter periplasmic adaptor subunit [Verrucomicrobia bacterium]|nr:efflux RND transporter periplasmic adaptor subunit [Verrucomicrobiota bacterium]
MVKVARGELAQSVTFDAELRPFQEIDLHAKVAGFLDRLNVDAGDRVEAGQAIGTLEIPELKAELDHALAAERRSQAAAEEAHQSFARLKTAADSQRGLISQQDLDIAQARDLTAEAARAEAKANVSKYRTMLDYTRITAPFAGVVTKRYVNVGALIQAGTSSSAVPLVRLSQNDRLRVVFPISLSFVARVKVGDAVEIRIPSAGKTLAGGVARFSRKVETATRTMEAEVDLANADLALIPGVYATVVLKLDKKDSALVVPVEAVARDAKGASIFVVTADKKIEERAVTLGVETPAKLEIVKGVAEGELVMIGSRTQIKPGQTVEVKLIETSKTD